MSLRVPSTRICRCGHDQGRHDLANRCLVRGCACLHCETVPDLRTKAGKAQAQRQLQAEQPAQERPRRIGVGDTCDRGDHETCQAYWAKRTTPPECQCHCHTDTLFTYLAATGNEPPTSEYPPCRLCGRESAFLLIAYQEQGWPTTPLCQDCLLDFKRQATSYVKRQS